MHKIKFKWVAFLLFFATSLLYCTLVFNVVQRADGSLSVMKDYPNNKKYSPDYLGFYDSFVKKLENTENTWSEYKNPALNWLGKIYFENDDKIALSPLWGDSNFFSEQDIPELKKVLKKVKKNPGEIIFHSFQIDKLSFLYFLYISKDSPSFIYIGGVNVFSIERKLESLDKPFQGEGTKLYLINNNMVLSNVDVNREYLGYIATFLFEKNTINKNNDFSIEVKKDNLLTKYRPVFFPSESLWILTSNTSTEKKFLYKANSFILFALPILFLALLNLIMFLFFIKPVLTISSMFRSEKIINLEKLTDVIRKVIFKHKNTYFFEMYKILYLLKEMSDELLNYKSIDDYKLIQYKKSIDLDYFERFRYEKQQRKNILYDSLTSLPNGFLLEDRISTSIKYIVREKRSTYLVIINVIHIKDIADEYSHVVSDSMIKSLSVKINEKVHEVGELYRCDYTKFAVLLTNMVPDYDIQSLIDRIFDVVNDPSAYIENPLSEGVPLDISCSIGIRLVNSSKFTAAELIETASENAEVCMVDENNKLRNNFKVIGKGKPSEKTLTFPLD